MRTSTSKQNRLPTLGDRTDGLGAGPSRPETELPNRSRRPAVVLAGLAIVAVLLGATAAYANGTFTDTGDSDFESDIEWLASHGIADGYPDGSFKPTEGASRQAVAAWFRRYNQQFTLVENSYTDDIIGGEVETGIKATCPEGMRALSGGGTADSSQFVIADSFPIEDESWAVFWESKDLVPVEDYTINVWALCGPDDIA